MTKEDNAENFENKEEKPSVKSDFKTLQDMLYIKKVPSFGNNFFFTVGVYLVEIGAILALTGIIMAVFGPYWWNTNPVGVFVRVVHLWASLAFVTLIIVHAITNLFTSTYKHKKLVWMIGVTMSAFSVLEYAFGVGMRGDFVAQWNAVAGADLWNGVGLGFWVNPLNEGAVYGWHIAILPIVLIGLITAHYGIVKQRGITLPYRKDIPYSIVKADHKKMYRRMAYIIVLILVLSAFFSPPYTSPLTVQDVSQEQPNMFALTLLSEFDFSSPTATYLDTINPYTFSTRQVYVTMPYETYATRQNINDSTTAFLLENTTVQNQYIAEAVSYFQNNGSIQEATSSTNPLISIIGRLVISAESGSYQQILQSQASSSVDHTYVLRLMSDSGVMDQVATQDGLQVEQWGILKVGPGSWSLSWFLFPYNLLEQLTGGISWWNDIENAVIALIAFIIVLFFLYIPYLKDAPDKLRLYKLYWNRFSLSEMKHADEKPKSSAPENKNSSSEQ